MPAKVFVGNLSYHTNPQALRKLFGAHGKITALHVEDKVRGGRRQRVAFVEFGTEDEAVKAVKALDGRELDGTRLRVDTRPL